MQNSPYRSLIISLIWSIMLNATIPVICYFFAKRFVSISDLEISTSFEKKSRIHFILYRFDN
jgi:hypothetical protein